MIFLINRVYVLDLPEPTLIALGEFIVKIMKQTRETPAETCNDVSFIISEFVNAKVKTQSTYFYHILFLSQPNSKYLDLYHDAPKQFDAITMAGACVYNNFNDSYYHSEFH